MRRTLLLYWFALMVPQVVGADDPVKSFSAVTEPLFEAQFVDGSVVMVSANEANVAINTKYGKLTVPLSEVKKIGLGFRYPDGLETQVQAAIKDLGATDYKTREEAQKLLIGFGEYSIPLVKTGLKDPSPEVAERCGQILKKLADKVPAEKMDPREADVIVTEELTIRGKIETTGFKVKNKYFGEAVVKLVDLREFRPVGGRMEGNFRLDSAKYAKQGWAAWYDTGIEVSKDQPLEITCTGRIDQWSQTPGQYMSGPNGTGSQVAGPGGAGVHQGRGRLGGPGPLGTGGPEVMAYQSGAVYGKVGANGLIFRIGESYKQAGAPATGKLYLIIAPSNWGNDSVGEYQVKVKSGK
jgi:hypothetical protein